MCSVLLPIKNNGFITKFPSLSIKVERMPAVPLAVKSLDFSEGKNFLTLPIMCLLERLLNISFDSSFMVSFLKSMFFILFISDPLTNSYNLGKASFKFVLVSYPYCEKTGHAFGPISLLPLDLIIQWGSKNGNCWNSGIEYMLWLVKCLYFCGAIQYSPLK